MFCKGIHIRYTKFFSTFGNAILCCRNLIYSYPKTIIVKPDSDLHLGIRMTINTGFGEHVIVTSQWVRWRLKSPASRLLVQPFVQAHREENINALRHWPLWWESTGDRWILAQRASDAEMFPFDDVFVSKPLFYQWWPKSVTYCCVTSGHWKLWYID